MKYYHGGDDARERDEAEAPRGGRAAPRRADGAGPLPPDREPARLERLAIFGNVAKSC